MVWVGKLVYRFFVNCCYNWINVIVIDFNWWIYNKNCNFYFERFWNEFRKLFKVCEDGKIFDFYFLLGKKIGNIIIFYSIYVNSIGYVLKVF